MIWTIILAAGESSRMAQPKLLLPFGEKTIIETVLDNATSSKTNYSLLITGGFREKIRQKASAYPVITVHNPSYKKGMLTSVQLGFRSLPPGAQAAIVLLADQPAIPTWVIDRIIDVYTLTPKGIVVPTFKKERGHPVLIDMKYEKEIQELSQKTGLRELIYSHSKDICEVPVDTSTILRDIDDLKDYKRELKTQSDLK